MITKDMAWYTPNIQHVIMVWNFIEYEQSLIDLFLTPSSEKSETRKWPQLARERTPLTKSEKKRIDRSLEIFLGFYFRGLSNDPWNLGEKKRNELLYIKGITKIFCYNTESAIFSFHFCYITKSPRKSI